MVLIEEERVILFGEGCGLGTLLLGDESTNIKTYKKSILRLKELENMYDIIIINYGTGN